MSAALEIQCIAVIVAVTCSLPGVFLVLRKMSMMADSITHTILLGIVLAFFVTGDLGSPFLIIGAALMGVITVWLTETVNKTRLVSEDSAIGIVFPLLFSIAIILISRYTGSIHLDTDSVLLGELAFAPFDRMVVFGIDIGAKSIYTMGVMLVLNIGLIMLFFKELKVVSFDPILATVLGISPTLVHYGLMTMVSLTTVSAFESVGSILVIAFMVGPPVTAYLLTNNLKIMLLLSSLFGAISGIAGYQAAVYFDVSIAGTMAVVVGIIFLVVFIFAPKNGLLGTLLKRQKQKEAFAKSTLLLHLYNQRYTKQPEEQTAIHTARQQLHWSENHMHTIVKQMVKDGSVSVSDQKLTLSTLGAERAEEIYIELIS